MPSTTSTTTVAGQGSAERWGPLWGARAADWAATEEQQQPTYQAALARIGIQPGQRVLDIGCGTGVFLQLAAQRGAQVWGLDASDALLQIARRRVPAAQLYAGEMQSLPFDDDSFDLVCGFNAFFFAQDMVAALREAGRVARPDAPVVIQVFGAPQRCDLEAVKVVTRPFMPAPPPGAPAAPALWRPGVLEELAAAAGLHARCAFDVSYAMEYPDAHTVARRLVAPAGIAALAGPEREEEVRARIVEALAPLRRADGSYRLDNEFHYLVATAPSGSSSPSAIA
jgi:SAM-dependent methyltransferase